MKNCSNAIRPDITALELEPGHPGLGDAGLHRAARRAVRPLPRHRLGGLGPPLITYTDEEQRIWREVSPQLDALHRQHASAIYLQAKDELGISAHEIPQLRHLSAQLERVSGMHLIPAEGLHPVPDVLLVHRRARVPGHPVHPSRSRPEFTPEPDMIHDCLGHVPPLVNHDYAALLTLLGKAAVSVATGDQVLALKRLSWFSIEFGLIDEGGETKVFGAGILSSTGEIPFSLSASVERRPFVTDEVIATDYDASRMQELLFVIPSFQFLRREVENLVRRFGVTSVRPTRLAGLGRRAVRPYSYRKRVDWIQAARP